MQILIRTLVFVSFAFCLSSATETASINAAYGKLPLSFEQNVGQTDEKALFVARGPGQALFLVREGAVLRLGNDILRFTLAGSHVATLVRGEGELAGKVNYVRGRDPNQWQLGVPTYSQVRYANVYDGVDLLFYGNQQKLEYDFVVAPGSDPNAVAFDVEGARKISLANDRSLRITTANGEVRWQAPVAYQLIAGTRRAVQADYVLEGQRVSFRLGNYDRRHTLVIDPVLVYSTYLGGHQFAAGNGIAIDGSGQAVVVGSTADLDFPTTPGAMKRTQNSTCGADGGSCFDVFVSKLNAKGTALVYSTYLGGTQKEFGEAVTFDGGGNAYVTGITESPDFPVSSGAFQTNFSDPDCSNLCGNAFVTKFSPSGALVYSTYLGGEKMDRGFAIGADAQGNAYVTGQTFSPDFPVTAGALQTSCPRSTFDGSCIKAFVTKLNPSGSSLVFSTFLGGSNGEEAHGLALDSSHNVYITGTTSSTDFPTTPTAYQRALISTASAFVTKINPSGNALVFSTYLGGDALGFGIDVDSARDPYVVGQTEPRNFPTTPGAFQTTAKSQNNVVGFVTKFNSTASALVYSTLLGQSGGNRAIKVDSTGNAYVTGFTFAIDFPTTPGGVQSKCNPSSLEDAYVTKLNPSGTDLVWSTCFGGHGLVFGNSLALRSNKVFAAGQTSAQDFPVTPGAFQTENKGSENAYIAQLVPPCTLSTTVPSVTICSPGSGATVSSPVRIIAAANHTRGIRALKVFVSGKLAYQVASDTMDARIPMVAGSRSVTVQAQDNQGKVFSKNITLNVSGGCLLPASQGVETICSPANNSTIDGAVRVISGSDSSLTVTKTQILVDQIRVFETPARGIDTRIPFNSGSHKLTVKGFHSDNSTFSRTFTVNVNNGADTPCTLNTVDPSVTICRPLNTARVNSPVRITAGVNSTYFVTLVQLYVDGTKRFEVTASKTLDRTLTLGSGSHRITVQAFTTGIKISQTINITVP